MQIADPIIHLEEHSGTYHIHVITWFNHTRFIADGYDALPMSPTSNVWEIRLFVTEDSGVPDMELLTPVVHTLTLSGVTLNSTAPFIEIEIYNTNDSSVVRKKKTHKDGASASAMPDPGTGNRT